MSLIDKMSQIDTPTLYIGNFLGGFWVVFGIDKSP